MVQSNAARFFQYASENMAKALAAVKAGMSGRKAAERFNVPHTTLARKIRRGHDEIQKMGPPSILRPDEETMLVKWMFYVADAGFPIEKEQLLNNVQNLIRGLKRKNPFQDDRPGDKWFKLFRKRHSDVAIRVAQNLVKSRAAVTEESLRSWFLYIQNYCEKNDLTTALESPNRIFNLDESAFFLSPAPGNVLVKKNTRTVYNFVANSDKECITVLLGGNAAGLSTPPMMVLKLKRLDDSHFNNIPNHWLIGTYKYLLKI